MDVAFEVRGAHDSANTNLRPNGTDDPFHNESRTTHATPITSQSVPTALIVADFFVPASVPSAELCLEDTVANTKGKKEKRGPKEGRIATSERGAESEVAHKWARWLHNPCHLGGPHRFKGGGQNQKWPTSGQGGYITPAAWGVPTASERGAESEVAHKWARWLHNPCRLGVPTTSERGAESEVAAVRNGNLSFWGPRNKCYITPAFPGIPDIGEQNQKWLPHPYLLGGPKEGGSATLCSGGSPTEGNGNKSGPQKGVLGGPQTRGQSQRWPTKGRK